MFLLVLVPLIFGGKVYNSLKAIMTFKIVVVFGFLLLVARSILDADTWVEIFTGFFKFGSVPVHRRDADGAPRHRQHLSRLVAGPTIADIDFSMIAVLGALAAISGNGGLTNTALSGYTRDQGWGMGKHVGAIPSVDRRRKASSCRTSAWCFRSTRESVAQLSPLVSLRAARSTRRVDAGLLRRRRAAEHALACSFCRAARRPTIGSPPA